MVMHLENIVPFGRSLDEYIHMFTLTKEDFSRSILGVGDGPASFNAEGTKLGYQIKSIDNQLQDLGFNCEIQQVNYELQPGGNQMLKITKNTM